VIVIVLVSVDGFYEKTNGLLFSRKQQRMAPTGKGQELKYIIRNEAALFHRIEVEDLNKFTEETNISAATFCDICNILFQIGKCTIDDRPAILIGDARAAIRRTRPAHILSKTPNAVIGNAGIAATRGQRMQRNTSCGRYRLTRWAAYRW
jgi:hypothetical protein